MEGDFKTFKDMNVLKSRRKKRNNRVFFSYRKDVKEYIIKDLARRKQFQIPQKIY